MGTRFKQFWIKLATLKSEHLKAIFICLMGLHGTHLVERLNSSKHSKITQCGMNEKTRLKLVTLKSKHLKVIFIHFMGFPSSRLIEGCNLSKHYKITQCGLSKRRGLKGLVGTK